MHIRRIDKTGVASIGHIYRAAEHAINAGISIAHIRGAKCWQQRAGCNFLRYFRIKNSHQRGHHVHGLREQRAAAAGLRGMVGVVNEQRNIGHFIEAGHDVFSPPVVLAQQKSVIGGDDQRCVFPQIVGVEFIQQATKFMVT